MFVLFVASCCGKRTGRFMTRKIKTLIHSLVSIIPFETNIKSLTSFLTDA